MVEHDKEKRMIYGRYESGAEFTEDLERMAQQHFKFAAKDTSWGRHEPDAWMGLSGVKPAKAGEGAYEMTKRLMQQGYEKGTNLIDQIGASIDAPMPVSIRRRMQWGDFGDELNMQSVWNGDLERAWRRPRSVSTRGPQRIRIVVDAISYGGAKAEVTAIRGAAAVKLADLLTSAGFSVQVSSAWTGSGTHALSVITKQYSQPIDIATLAATTVLPSFFRCLGHMWGPLTQGRNDCGGYGVGSLTMALVETLCGEDSKSMTFIAAQSLETNEQANKWVKKCIDAIEEARNPSYDEEALAA